MCSLGGYGTYYACTIYLPFHTRVITVVAVKVANSRSRPPYTVGEYHNHKRRTLTSSCARQTLTPEQGYSLIPPIAQYTMVREPCPSCMYNLICGLCSQFFKTATASPSNSSSRKTSLRRFRPKCARQLQSVSSMFQTDIVFFLNISTSHLEEELKPKYPAPAIFSFNPVLLRRSASASVGRLQTDQNDISCPTHM